MESLQIWTVRRKRIVERRSVFEFRRPKVAQIGPSRWSIDIVLLLFTVSGIPEQASGGEFSNCRIKQNPNDVMLITSIDIVLLLFTVSGIPEQASGGEFYSCRIKQNPNDVMLITSIDIVLLLFTVSGIPAQASGGEFYSCRIKQNPNDVMLITFQQWRTYSAAAQDAVRSLKEGDKLHGYRVNKVTDVPELYLAMVALRHEVTGAEHLHAARDDDNNTFSVAFRTTPLDSTGVPHILEHTTLCGSRTFPVRDPFFKMLSRSLATFMNAFTAYDWTMYPFSTQNPQDFRNLLAVYLDAVFYPTLRELDFSQEGWRLEHKDPQDKSSPLVFKGVVYNEMKGVFSSSHDLFAQAAHNRLLPSHTYGVVSGGDPAHIPELSWEQLKDFHKTHYHPSNSRFFTYGSFPLEEHLRFINENYLQHFKQISVNTAVPVEPRWPQPKTSDTTCPPDPMAPDPQKQTTVAVSFLLQDITDNFEAFTMGIVGDLLVNGETAPFYRSLLEANIGSGYSPVLGYDGHTKEATFSVGLQGIKEDDVNKVRQIISETFDRVIQEGFEQKNIDAVLHKIELALKHQTENFGLALAVGAISTWIHDGDPSELLQINKHVKMFKHKLRENPRFLQEKVQQYFKENRHSLTLKMKPDEEYEKKRQTGEEERLGKLVAKLSDHDREQIYSLGQELMKQQMSTEDFTCLPTLKLDDIDPKIKPEIVQTTSFNGVPVVYSAQPTNEVTYVQFVSSLDDVPDRLKSYVPLFCNVITRMGAGPYDFKSLSQEIDLFTGGLSTNPHLSAHLTSPNEYEQGVVFSSHCLEQNTEKMLNLWTQIFQSPDFSDTNRLKTLVQIQASELANSLAMAGHSYAIAQSASQLNAVSQTKECFSGISQVSFMKKIAESSNLTELVSHLQEIGRHLLNKNRLRLLVNATPESMDSMLALVDKFSQNLPGTPALPDGFQYKQDKSFTPRVLKTQIELPFSVNYMSKSYPSVPYGHPDYPVLKVLGNLLSRKYLHREIREKGGAYGSGATNAGGCFSFFSYRDPRSLQTLAVFDAATQWAADGEFTATDVDEAKLGVFQQTDRPVPPGRIGKMLFLEHITDDMRQASRDKLISVTQGHLKDVAERYLLKSAGPTGVSFLGPANEAVKNDSSWKVVKE